MQIRRQFHSVDYHKLPVYKEEALENDEKRARVLSQRDLRSFR